MVQYNMLTVGEPGQVHWLACAVEVRRTAKAYILDPEP